MRVGITTSADRLERVSEPFLRAGLDPVLLPCVRIEPMPPAALAGARRSVGEAAVLLLGSVRALDVLWPEGQPPPVPVIAVGGATAAAVRERGGSVEFTGSGGLHEVADEADLDGRAVVFPHSAGTDRSALHRIAQRASSLSAPVVYAAVPLPPDDGEVDAVAFGSPSAVRGWLMARNLEHTLVGAIGATTTGYLESRGVRVDCISPRPDFDALAAAMATQLEVVA
ncbi:uroporphyrinogen-III synthase [bacterium]|nr:uroporphyrinogen-III synthase [bacterium]